MGESRETRLAQHLVRQASGFDESCIRKFLWYFKPDGSWEFVLGDPGEDHWILWRRKGRPSMAHDWGIGVDKIPTMDSSWVPSGYVDHVPVGIREVMVFRGPTVYPEGWNPERIKQYIGCADRPMRIESRPDLNTDPDMVQAYHKMFKRIQEESSGG